MHVCFVPVSWLPTSDQQGIILLVAVGRSERMPCRFYLLIALFSLQRQASKQRLTPLLQTDRQSADLRGVSEYCAVQCHVGKQLKGNPDSFRSSVLGRRVVLCLSKTRGTKAAFERVCAFKHGFD